MTAARRPVPVPFSCPTCHGAELVPGAQSLRCPACGAEYPVVDERPILICEARSLFSFEDYVVRGGQTTMHLAPERGGAIRRAKAWLRRFIPEKSRNIATFTPEDAVREIAQKMPGAKILVIGAGDAPLEKLPGVEMTYSDVALGPLTDLIADGHDLPFADGTFDLVIAAAVMEHVMNPQRVAEEVRRILKARGAVYASTPFMQQVHMGRYDFCRFTPVGHRSLWRGFDETHSGLANGPGMTVVWSLEYFLRALIPANTPQSIACYLMRFLATPFLWLDGTLRNRPAAYDGASGHYFFGYKRPQPLSDREIIASYKGAQ